MVGEVLLGSEEVSVCSDPDPKRLDSAKVRSLEVRLSTKVGSEEIGSLEKVGFPVRSDREKEIGKRRSLWANGQSFGR